MLNISTRDEGGVLILDISGQIDGGPESERIHEIIKKEVEKGQKKFLLNLKDVKWLNSLGAGMLIASYASAKREEAALKLLSVSDRVGVVLKTCGLIPEVFETFEDEAEAVTSF